MNTRDYDYAQPIVYGAGANVGSQLQPVQLVNPFGTDAEACIEFFFSTGTSGFVAVAADTAPTINASTLGGVGNQPGQNGALGYFFPVPLISGFHSDYYFPVKQFLNLIASLSSASFILVVGWRREKEVYIPQPVKPFNEPTA